MIMLSIHAVGQHNSDIEHISCSDLIAMTKMTAEATLSDTKPFLGWVLDTRSFTIKMKEHKEKVW